MGTNAMPEQEHSIRSVLTGSAVSPSTLWKKRIPVIPALPWVRPQPPIVYGSASSTVIRAIRIGRIGSLHTFSRPRVGVAL